MIIRRCYELGGEFTELTYPACLQDDIDVFFGALSLGQGNPTSWAKIRQSGPREFELTTSLNPLPVLLQRHDLPAFVMEAVIEGLITDQSRALALHAGGVVHNDKAIIVSGITEAGKSVLTALLVEFGFGYLTDEIILIDPKQSGVEFLPRALTLRQDSLVGLPTDGLLSTLTPVEGSGRHLYPVSPGHAAETIEPGLLLFPRFDRGGDLQISTMSAAETTSRLLQGNLNAKNLRAGGLPIASRLARRTPALKITYGHSDQLIGVIKPVIHHIIDQKMSAADCRRYYSAFSLHQNVGAPPPPVIEPEREILPPTEPRGKRKLTIGMATYDDFDGVYFSVQSIRLYHGDLMDDIEILVVDNNPTGVCAEPLKRLENDCASYRYVPYAGHSGTAIRDAVFAEASGDFVLLMDCHVLLLPGGLGQLMEYLDENPTTTNLLQGPMVADDLSTRGTHFTPKWSAGMYGIWDKTDEADDPTLEPFEIQMQGLGLFVCRKEAWAWFNPDFRGFGGEEGYIHEKFRQRGDKTLCLPFLRWLHRFPRPMGIPYKPNWQDRMRNYVLGWQELGLDQSDMREHFIEVLGDGRAKRIFSAIDSELANPFWHFDAIRCINLIKKNNRRDAMLKKFRSLGIEERATFWPAVATPENHHIGCALSHRQIIEDAKRRGLENVLVFEDDAIFHKDIMELLPGVTGELQQIDWQILLLGGRNWEDEAILVPGCQSLSIAGKVTCTHAVAYHQSVYDELLAALPDNKADMEIWLEEHIAIDQYFANNDFEKLITCPTLATQKPILPAEDSENRKNFTL